MTFGWRCERCRSRYWFARSCGKCGRDAVMASWLRVIRAGTDAYRNAMAKAAAEAENEAPPFMPDAGPVRYYTTPSEQRTAFLEALARARKGEAN